MKKLIFLTLLSALALGISSCEKDATSLAGTSWYFAEEGVFCSFSTESTGTVFQGEDYAIDEMSPVPFTYTYSPPTITLNAMGEVITGTIQGNTMYLDGAIYIKQ